MTVPFDRVARKVYDALVNANYDVALYDEGGNRVFDAEKARKFFTLPNRSFIAIHDDGDEKSKIKVALSSGDNLKHFENHVGKKLRLIAAQEGQNMSYDIRSFGKQLTPKDFAHTIKQESSMSDAIAEAKWTGTTRSSYQKVGECKVIVRHSGKVNEEKQGARSRNINAIFVETKSGERFKLATNNIHGARAMARHLSNGGSPFDTVGVKVTNMMEEMSELRNIMKEVRSVQRKGLQEEASELANNVSIRFCSLRENLKKMSGKVGYWKHTEDIREAEELNEYDENNLASYENILNRLGYKRLGGGAVGSEITFARRPHAQYNVLLKIHPMSGDIVKWWIEDLTGGERVSQGTTLGELFKVAKQIKEVQEDDEPVGFVKTNLPKNARVDNPLHELVLRMNQALEPKPQMDPEGKQKHKLDKLGHPQLLYDPSEIKDDEEWKAWTVASDKLAALLADSNADPLTQEDKKILFKAAQRLGVDLQTHGSTIKKAPEKKQKSDDEIRAMLSAKGVPDERMADAIAAYKERMGITEMDEGTPIEGKIDVDEKKVKDEEPREDQIPVYDRPEEGTDKCNHVKELTRDSAETMHSANYYEEGKKLPEIKMLESWFDSISNVEFFREEELKLEEDNAPTIKKTLPETALYNLNMYKNHPLFNHFMTIYENQKVLDDVMGMVKEDSELYLRVVEAREKLKEGPLVEFDWSTYDPQMIDAAVDKARNMVSDRRKNLNDAIKELAHEIASAHFGGDQEAEEVLAKEIHNRAEEEGLVKHDFGSTFADDSLSANDEIDGHKAEVDAEEYYGDAKFQEEGLDEAPMGSMEDPGHYYKMPPEDDEEDEELDDQMDNEVEEDDWSGHDEGWVHCLDCGEESHTDRAYCPKCGSKNVEEMPSDEDDYYDDSMDGDAESALASAGWGTDEDYGSYGGWEEGADETERLRQLAGLKAESIVNAINNEGKKRDVDGDGDIDNDDWKAARDKAIKKLKGKEVDEATKHGSSAYAKAKKGGYYSDKVSAFSGMDAKSEEHLRRMLAAKGVPDERMDAAVAAYKNRKQTNEAEISRFAELAGLKKKIVEADPYRNEPAQRDIDLAFDYAEEFVNRFYANDPYVKTLKGSELHPEDRAGMIHDLRPDVIGYVQNGLASISSHQFPEGIISDDEIWNIFVKKYGADLNLGNLDSLGFKEDAATDKKAGRRAAGSWGKPGSSTLKRAANKATRQAGKADFGAPLGSDEYDWDNPEADAPYAIVWHGQSWEWYGDDRGPATGSGRYKAKGDAGTVLAKNIPDYSTAQKVLDQYMANWENQQGEHGKDWSVVDADDPEIVPMKELGKHFHGYDPEMQEYGAKPEHHDDRNVQDFAKQESQMATKTQEESDRVIELARYKTS